MSYRYAIRLVIQGTDTEFTLCTCCSPEHAAEVARVLLSTQDPTLARVIIDAVPAT